MCFFSLGYSTDRRQTTVVYHHSSYYTPPLGPPPQTFPLSSSGLAPTSFCGSPSTGPPPPEWTASSAVVHDHGLLSDATPDEFSAAEQFCDDTKHAVDEPRMLPSYQIDDIQQKGAQVWSMEPPQMPKWSGLDDFPALKLPRWFGGIDGTSVVTSSHCRSVCLLSNLPLIGYCYNTPSSGGVYFEVKVIKMAGVIAIGTACKPYPAWWRLPGWNRLSYALHLDDYRTFDGPDGGSDYEPLYHNPPREGSTFGCGFDFSERSIFFTYEGKRLLSAYRGIYPGVYKESRIPGSDSAIPSEGHYDVYAAVGVEGECKFEVNFGVEEFLWEEGNLQRWKVENQFLGDELPGYGSHTLT